MQLARTILLAGSSLLMVATPLAAQDGGRSTSLGLRGGFIAPGAFYLEEGPYDSYDLALSFTGGVSLDYRVAPRFLVGVFSDLTMMNAFDESALYFEGGIALKAVIERDGRFPSYRPYFAIGGGNLGPIYTFESTQYLTLRLGSEILFRSLFAEAALYGAPLGGNAEVTTWFGPVAVLRIGRFF